MNRDNNLAARQSNNAVGALTPNGMMKHQCSPVTIRELLAGNVQLASPPEVFLKINQVIDDPAKSMLDVSRLIEHDPGLSARLLRIVNSAFYGFPAKITSIAHAISIIGIQELRDLVLATLVVEKFSSLPNGLMTMRQFWTMSVRCALISRLLAARHQERRRLGAAFICGLLHEIGRLIIYHRLPELARTALFQARTEGVDEHKAERDVMGFDHYQVGAELARRWRLPEVIVVTIENHDSAEASEMFNLETLLVVLASALSNLNYNDRELLDSQLPAPDAPFWRQISLQRDIVDEVLAEAETCFYDIFKQIYPD